MKSLINAQAIKRIMMSLNIRSGNQIQANSKSRSRHGYKFRVKEKRLWTFLYLMRYSINSEKSPVVIPVLSTYSKQQN